MSRAPQKPTLEELLRLKRAERPADEFWARFDAGLRAKQLSALVEKPSWTAALRARLAWFAAPLGATAAAALAVTVWLQTRPVPLAVAPSAPRPAAMAVSAPTVAEIPAVAETSSPVQTVTEVAVSESGPATLSPAPGAEATVVAVRETAPDPEPLSVNTPFGISVPLGLPAVNESTFAAVVMPASGLELAAAPLSDSFSFPPADTAVTAEIPRATPKDDARVGEKVLRSLDEEKLHASSRRLVALDGGRVSFKLW
jgi:hypothetical protein